MLRKIKYSEVKYEEGMVEGSGSISNIPKKLL